MKYNLLLCRLIFVVVLFMVLRDDTINQTMLVPMDLRNLIPEDHPCYFIKNVVDQIDCSQANRVFADKPGEFAYPRELLLRLILMSVFDGGLSSHEIERKQGLTLLICTWQGCSILVIVQLPDSKWIIQI
jgi:hypothetical protein